MPYRSNTTPVIVRLKWRSTKQTRDTNGHYVDITSHSYFDVSINCFGTDEFSNINYCSGAYARKLRHLIIGSQMSAYI
jgi:hypothetical protein